MANRWMKLLAIGVSVYSLVSCASTASSSNASVNPSSKTEVVEVKQDTQNTQSADTATQDDKATGTTQEPGANNQQNPPPNQGVNIQAQSEEERKKMEEMLKNLTMEEQESKVRSNILVEQAKGLISQQKFDEAKKVLEAAVNADPGNGVASEMLSFVNQILNKPSTKPTDDVKSIYEVLLQQTNEEIKKATREGMIARQERRYDEALRNFETAELKIKTLSILAPETKVISDMLQIVQKELRQIKVEKEEAEREELRLRRKAAEEEKKAEEEVRKRETLNRVAQMLEMAYLAFDNYKYDRTIQICDAILAIDPNYVVARELKEDAFKAKRHQVKIDVIQRKVESWRAMMRESREASIPYQDTFRYPDQDIWRQVLERAREMTLGVTQGEDEESPDVKEVMSKLSSSRVSFDFEKINLLGIIDQLSERTQITFIIDPRVQREKESDLQKEIPFRYKGITVKKALELALESFGLTYVVDPGQIVRITDAASAAANVVVELYDVKDLMLPIRMYNGPDFQLKGSEEGGPPIVQGTEQEPKLEENTLVEVVKSYAGGTWDEPYKINTLPTGQLIVVHTPAIHKRVREFLERARTFTGMMIGVTGRFVSIFNDTLEDIAVDIMRRPPSGNFYDITAPKTPFTDIEEAANSGSGGQVGPGYVSRTTARNEMWDVRAQVFNTFLEIDPATGTIRQNPIDNRVKDQGGLGLQVQWIGQQALQMVLRAMYKSHKATVMQAPRITVSNGQRGYVLFASRVAYVRDYNPVAVGFVAQYDPEIGYVTHGSSMEVRPIVSYNKRYVTMELIPQIAELQIMRPAALTGVSLPLELPWIVLQKAQLTAIVPDRGTVIVSGFRDVVNKTLDAGVPFLQNIPIVNFFASRRVKVNEQRNLYVLATAEIIDISEREEQTGLK